MKRKGTGRAKLPERGEKPTEKHGTWLRVSATCIVLGSLASVSAG